MSEKMPFDWKQEIQAAEGGVVPPELQQSNEDILTALPPARVAAEVQRRMERQKKSRLPLFWIPLPIMAVAAVLLLARSQPADEVRVKGEPHLIVYEGTKRGPRRIAQDEAARPGELIQIRYNSIGVSYGAVVSVDGRGGVTLHYPEEATGSTALAPGGETALPHAYELDDAPAFERFFFVTSSNPIDVPGLIVAAHSLAAKPDLARIEPLPVGPGQHQSSFMLRKVSP